MISNWKRSVTRAHNATSQLTKSVQSMVRRPLALASLSISLLILVACASLTSMPDAPASEHFIPCVSAPPIIWAPGEVDDQMSGDLLEQSRQAALDHVARVLKSVDTTNPSSRALAVATIREIMGDPSDVVGQIKGMNAVIDDRCPALIPAVK